VSRDGNTAASPAAAATCCVCAEAGGKHCAECKSRHYCSKKCQRFDWNQGGHKAQCKRLTAENRCLALLPEKTPTEEAVDEEVSPPPRVEAVDEEVSPWACFPAAANAPRECAPTGGASDRALVLPDEDRMRAQEVETFGALPPAAEGTVEPPPRVSSIPNDLSLRASAARKRGRACPNRIARLGVFVPVKTAWRPESEPSKKE
jgi:hypothetical protein